MSDGGFLTISGELASSLSLNTPFDVAIERVLGDKYLGGSSGPGGWSARSDFMTCAYKRRLHESIEQVRAKWRKLDNKDELNEAKLGFEEMLTHRKLPMPRYSEALEIGSLFHLLLANRYVGMMPSLHVEAKKRLVRCSAKCRAGITRAEDGSKSICTTCLGKGKIEAVEEKKAAADRPATFDLEWLHKRLLDERVNPTVVSEAYRIYRSYDAEYDNDPIRPIAVEVRVEYGNISARYDLVAEILPNVHGWAPGTWIVEHKTASREDAATMEGWQNDGQIFGQQLLWRRAGLTRKYGELRGVLVNIAIKTQTPKFRRVFVPVDDARTRAHEQDLAFWDLIRHMCDAAGVYPRNRSQCTGRYGKCEFFDHCALS